MTEWAQQERLAYFALSQVPGIGASRLAMLLKQFRFPSAVLQASLDDLRGVAGISPAAATAITHADLAVADRVLTALAGLGGQVLLPGDPYFPELLRNINDTPTCLFASGELELLTRPAVAIVGSREHSHYGREVCEAVARAATLAGLVVVSGMARGLDAVAHWGALAGSGATIGILGNGLGVIYPAANRKLYQAVADRGLLLTEFPPGERPSAGSFQRRNRLISGLARVTLVIEAAKTSGALLTAQYALDQGREVLALPGPIMSPVSAGTNGLIRDGAAPLLELDDLLRYYPEITPVVSPSVAVSGTPAPIERRLLNALQIEPLLTEQLVEQVGAPVVETLDALAALELGGQVKQELGGRYRLVAAGLFR
jgi:DNA processing protein